jgi:hypothetical protein
MDDQKAATDEATFAIDDQIDALSDLFEAQQTLGKFSALTELRLETEQARALVAELEKRIAGERLAVAILGQGADATSEITRLNTQLYDAKQALAKKTAQLEKVLQNEQIVAGERALNQQIERNNTSIANSQETEAKITENALNGATSRLDIRLRAAAELRRREREFADEQVRIIQEVAEAEAQIKLASKQQEFNVVKSFIDAELSARERLLNRVQSLQDNLLNQTLKEVDGFEEITRAEESRSELLKQAEQLQKELIAGEVKTSQELEKNIQAQERIRDIVKDVAGTDEIVDILNDAQLEAIKLVTQLEKATISPELDLEALKKNAKDVAQESARVFLDEFQRTLDISPSPTITVKAEIQNTQPFTGE